jgi:hypothetical protein
VAIDGEALVVGANLEDIGGQADQGAAYVFTSSGTVWSEQEKLIAADGGAGDLFGDKVALSGNMAVVGAWRADINAQSNQGGAYVFTRSGTTWGRQLKLAASDGAAGDQFGFAVDISDSTIAVGASLDDIVQKVDQGSVYIAGCQNQIYLPIVRRKAA